MPVLVEFQRPQLITVVTCILTFIRLLYLQLSLLSNDLAQHEMLVSANAMAWDNHNQVPFVGHLVFIMCHELSRVNLSLPVFGNDVIAVNSDVDRLLHLGAHNGSHQGPSRDFSRRIMNELPARNGGVICYRFIRQAGKFNQFFVHRPWRCREGSNWLELCFDL